MNDGKVVSGGEAAPHDYEVRGSDTVYDGKIITVVVEQVQMPDGEVAQRDVVRHPGAVGVLALDADERVLFVRQWRQPVRRRLEEVPAGLLDKNEESGLEAAQRELAEEAGVAATTWHVLLDLLTSPGMTDESIRLYLARDLSEVPLDPQGGEELEMTSSWLPLEEAVDAVLAGQLENATACAAVLAASEARRRGFTGLRDAAAPWRARPDRAG